MENSVRCSHILQKHTQSRNPMDSYRNKPITRSPQEAWNNILQIRENILNEGLSTFAQYAKKYSECRSAAKGGDLGPFGRGEMQKEFENASFALKVGDMSEIISTDSGYHIILRTE